MKIKRDLKRFLKLKLGQIRSNFNYFNIRVYFPKNSLIFRMACDEGIYDKEVFDFIFSFLKESSLFIDVGTNIGLLSIPVLKNYNKTEVISFEPSKSVFPYLRKTHLLSGFNNRWSIYEKALGNSCGIINFKRNRELDSAFDGISITNNSIGGEIYDEVEITTIDKSLKFEVNHYPSIVIKIDVEGFELSVLNGARNFIKIHKPYIVIEIVKDFLSRYNFSCEDYINFANENNYKLYALTTLNQINNINELELSMTKNLNFVLLPN